MRSHPVRQLFVIATVVLTAACAKKPEPRLPVRVVTAPEIAPLASHLGSVFRVQSHAQVNVVPLAAPALLDEAKHGTADVVITNDPATVAALRSAGLVRLASIVATDAYLIAGPSRNPAHVGHSDDATGALRHIFMRRQRFCSFVDVAPIHEREQRIWSAASIQPEKNRHYQECRGDALVALRKAALAGAYIVVDRATFESVKPARFESFVRGGPFLANDVTVLLIEKGHRLKDAEWFVEWMMSFRGLDAVDNYRVDGQKGFYTQR
ncbi:MAG TPA: substrate-binding domain-containing protein [Thermoanaerobaculia bacterium]|nr:substrate-binding domain-containing protein [Thermoanaerobaculia bacterium]